jgi:hypothetical protein
MGDSKMTLANSELIDEILTQNSSFCSVMDADGRIIYVSPQFNATLGTTSKSLIGRFWGDTGISPNFVDAMERARAEVISTKKEISVSINASDTIGIPVYECKLSPSFHPDGTIKHIISSYIINAETGVDELVNYFYGHILNKLQETSDIDEAIPVVLSYISSSFNADIVTMLFRLEDQWYPKYVHGATNSPHDVIFLEEHAALAHLIKKKNEVFTISHNNTSYFAKMLPDSWGIRSMAAVPLHIQGEVFAILTVSSRRDSRPFTEFQKGALSKVSSIMALALSEDRYIWSREGEVLLSRRNFDSIDAGVALINGFDNSIIWSNQTYNDIIPVMNQGMDIMNLNYYQVCDKFDRVNPDEVIKMVTYSSGPQAYGCFQKRNKSGVITQCPHS